MVAAMLFAIQTATASARLTIKWNTHTTASVHPSMPQASTGHPEVSVATAQDAPYSGTARSKDAEASRRSIQVGTLMSVKNRTVSVRLADGSIRTFVATGNEVSALRALIGTRIAFRVTP